MILCAGDGGRKGFLCRRWETKGFFVQAMGEERVFCAGDESFFSGSGKSFFNKKGALGDDKVFCTGFFVQAMGNERVFCAGDGGSKSFLCRR